MSENCERCGQEGEDRRTIWMACLYDMNELEIPLAELAIQGVYCDRTGMTNHPLLSKPTATFSPHEGAESHLHRFYTIRVCKQCRADWLQAQKKWFHSWTRRDDESCGSGIFVRTSGVNEEITEEEWHKRNGHDEH